MKQISTIDTKESGPSLITSVAGVILCIFSFIMIIQFVIISLIIIIGDLLITVNLDTGEKINGAEKIIPDIMRENVSFIVFIVGIILFVLACSALKKNGKREKSDAKILTMEEVKDENQESVIDKNKHM